MLTLDLDDIIIPEAELYDERKNEFIQRPEVIIKGGRLCFEHSLISVGKWEAKWNNPYFESDNMTAEQFQDYIRCMLVSQPRDIRILDYLTADQISSILKYMEAPNSAYKIRKNKIKKKTKDLGTMTTETIYFLMIQYGIPMDCEKWHLNRLFSLIDICANEGNAQSVGGGQAKKMSEKELMSFYNTLNDSRRRKLNSKG